jgi:anti-sigma factor ChrR (cupin superfamily)
MGEHFDEETAERYASGSLSARTAAPFEEHLLACERCRKSVTAAEAYLASMRQAAAKLREASRKPKKRSANSGRQPA